MAEKLHVWEDLESFGRFKRCRVPGGWLYWVKSDNGLALQFVPEPPTDTLVELPTATRDGK